MSKKIKISLLLISTFIVFCFGIKFYLDKTYLNQFEREDIVGEDRYETMVKVSEKRWKKSKEAVLVNSSKILEATTSAAPFAYKKDIPMFFIEQDNLNDTIKDELEKLGVEKIYLIGGVSSISDSTEKELNELNIETDRIAGQTDLETTLLLAKIVIEESNTKKMALVNSEYGIPNAISFLPVAQKNNIPIISIKNNNEDDIINFANENNIEEVYILGSEEQISTSIENNFKKSVRINGKDRYDTNKKIIERFYNTDEFNNVYITKGGVDSQAEFLNALSISPIAARENAPLILSRDVMDKELLTFLEDYNVKKITEVGFKFERPELINETSIRYIVNIIIIILSIFGLKRIIFL